LTFDVAPDGVVDQCRNHGRSEAEAGREPFSDVGFPTSVPDAASPGTVNRHITGIDAQHDLSERDAVIPCRLRAFQFPHGHSPPLETPIYQLPGSDHNNFIGITAIPRFWAPEKGHSFDFWACFFNLLSGDVR
jgi:hypothetical protein